MIHICGPFQCENLFLWVIGANAKSSARGWCICLIHSSICEKREIYVADDIWDFFLESTGANHPKWRLCIHQQFVYQKPL